MVHSYDVERRQVLCGCSGETSSTKHAAGVTCTACRELLDHGRPKHPPLGTPAGHGE